MSNKHAVLYNEVEDGSDVFRDDNDEPLTVTLPVEETFDSYMEAVEWLDGRMGGYYTIVELPDTT